ncbi:MAG: catalase [Nitrospirales bacterium]|nr:catalase [Nitrospirales bacterium]
MMILTPIGCDTVPTHPDNPIHLDILAKHKTHLYPNIDPFLGEKLHPNEQQLAYQIADEVMYTVDRTYDQENQQAFRDAHPKENGCVNAEFHVKKMLPPQLAKGVFTPGHTYEALIRFSNSSENPKGNDHDADARGMAIKLLTRFDTPSGHIDTKPQTMTQDFIMINHPVFILDDPSDYLSLVQAQNSTNTFVKLVTIPFALGLTGIYNAYQTIFQDEKVKNPLQTQYFSMVPYRLGKEDDPERIAIKYSAKAFVPPIQHMIHPYPEIGRSCVTIDSEDPQKNDTNYLRTALRKTLQTGDACMEFLVQQGAKGMSVENSQIEWKDQGDSAFESVALIKIPKQHFDEKESPCENESFNPWHAGEEHLPLGGVNRLRKVIYPIVSEYRYQLNHLGQAKRSHQAGIE